MPVTTENIWETFHSRLRQFILRRVPDEQCADDLLQDVFLKVHTRIGTLHDEEKLAAWLYQLTRNAIIDYYRTTRATTEIPDLPYEPEYRLEDVVWELAPCIQAMIESLPETYRQALILTQYQGLTQQELAQRLNLSLPGAKSRVQRAREKLKTLLLDCCHFEFDRLGHVIDYQPHCACCAQQGSSPACVSSC
jgi:RNA polymerase sigma-70 factor, ECF subfamily